MALQGGSPLRLDFDMKWIDIMKRISVIILLLYLFGFAAMATPGVQFCPPQLPGVVPEIGEIKFLWPKDESDPGNGFVELMVSGDLRKENLVSLIGNGRGYVGSLKAPSGEEVVELRYYQITTDEEFEAYIIETELKKSITAPTGNFGETHFALPAITPPRTHDQVLNFAEAACSPPVYKPVASTGPKIIYSDNLETIVFSPLDKYLIAIGAPHGKTWHCGLEGLVEEISAGYCHKVLIVTGQGVTDTFMKWGELIRKYEGHEIQDPYRDVGIGYLGYYTDNGAYYYYKAAPGMNEHETLIAVKEEADRLDIPYRYFQIDSWWYPKRATDSVLALVMGGSIVWEPIPEKFPQGLTVFQEELGLPLVAHNRWYDETTPYCDRYECVYGHGIGKPALPIESEFWNEIMDNAVSYGVQVYEQDWLATQMDSIPWLRSGINNAELWFDNMIRAADERGLTVQLCMASPGFFLQQMKHPNVTHTRAGTDYMAGAPKNLYWDNFQTSSLLAYATGMYPWKDVHLSSRGQRLIRDERWPLEETLIANLSAGPVGPGDKLGYVNKELIMRTCMTDGTLLKPDQPAFPIDEMFLRTKKPWTSTTFSDHEVGRVIYVAAFNLWPHKTFDMEISLEELGITDESAVWDWMNKRLYLNADKIDFGFMPLYDARYYQVLPVLRNGMVLIGEHEKFITLSRKRFPSIELEGDTLVFEVQGEAGEQVELMIYSHQALTVERAKVSKSTITGVSKILITIPDSGLTYVEVR